VVRDAIFNESSNQVLNFLLREWGWGCNIFNMFLVIGAILDGVSRISDSWLLTSSIDAIDGYQKYFSLLHWL
jgi:hypothetical protein